MVSAHRSASAVFRGGKRVLLMGHAGFKSGWLALDITKTCIVSGVSPSCPGRACRQTMACYRKQLNGADSRAMCEAVATAYGHCA